MDLALHLGRPADELAQSITEDEFRRWMTYARRHALPYRRLELMLAQMSLVIAKTMGGAKNAKVSDFMLQDHDDELPPNVTRLEAARMAFAFNPRRKKA